MSYGRKKAFAKYLLACSTRQERALFERLRDRQLGVSFVPQEVVGDSIVDLWCEELKLIVEIDGPSHLRRDVFERDVIRDRVMRNHGVRVVRFDNSEIDEDLDSVVDQLRYIIKQQQEAA